MTGLKGPGAIRRRAAERNNENEDERNDDRPTRGRPGEREIAEPKPIRPAAAVATRRAVAPPAAARRPREPEFVRPNGKGSDDLVVVLDDIDPKKNSVRFNATDKDAAVSSIYINNSGIPNRAYNRVRITVEFLND